MRIFTISDIHVDYDENRQWMEDLSGHDYKEDILILSGDVSHHFDLLKDTLLRLKQRFAYLFFTPGNHDLWIRNEGWQDSIEKFERIYTFCEQNAVFMSPQTLKAHKEAVIRIVPLHSWYTTPEQGADSLYIPKPGEDESNRMWSDNYFVNWPDSFKGYPPIRYFMELNRRQNGNDLAPTISFSHFLPRQDVMFSEDRQRDRERMKKYDRMPAFNFSRVAGSSLIERQLRTLGSSIHIYGHQHINRERVIERVRYVAHCLGYPNERRRGAVRGIEQGLKQIVF